ncbi:MAG: transposase [Candidatus Brocadiales bacterium]|nr:transposase [Candidatus Brocadiales bacterium]
MNFHAKRLCGCGKATTIRNTREKTVITGDIGKFKAIEIQTYCKHCDTIYRSEELRQLTPHGGKYGFDIIEYIGKELFLHCRSERSIQTELGRRNIPISLRKISFLGKRFIIYLALAHRESQEELRSYIKSKGGYILHMDGTCEGGSPHLFSCIDEISNIVLGNRKMPTEDSKYIVPLLKALKAAYGIPIALVHDMGAAILKAVSEVFPDIPDYICHFHFLRNLGKDLFDFEYRSIRRYTRSFNVHAKLNKAAKQLDTIIRGDKKLSDSLELYLNNKTSQRHEDDFDPRLTAYLLMSWILEYSSVSNGFGFPFDQPHLEFYLRLQEAYPLLKQLKENGVKLIPLDVVRKTLADSALNNLVQRIQEKISIFEELRTLMRIARPENNQGLNDDGDEDIQTIEGLVKKFRHSQKIVSLASNDISYQKMIKQIDKYWDKLFAAPIEIETPIGKIIILPQRTNNIMEQAFRFLKRDARRKNGQHSLTKTLKGMLADTTLLRNLSNPDYVAILLKGKKDLANRFADIDIQQVQKEEKENEQRWRKYPKKMRKLFKIPNLPEKLVTSQ